MIEKEEKLLEVEDFLNEISEEHKNDFENKLSRLEERHAGFLSQLMELLTTIDNGSFDSTNEYGQCSDIGEDVCYVNLFKYKEGDNSFGDMFKIVVLEYNVQVYMYDRPRDVFIPVYFHEEYKPITYTIDQCSSLLKAVRMGVDYFLKNQNQ